MEKDDGKGDDVPPLEDRPLPTHIWPDGEEATVVDERAGPVGDACEEAEGDRLLMNKSKVVR